MGDADPQFALRELRRHMLTVRTLAVLVLIGGVLTIIAPFGSGRALSVLPLAAFWIGLVALTYAIGMSVHLLLGPRARKMPLALGTLFVATVTGIAVAIAVDALTGLLFGWPETLSGVLRDLARDFTIGFCVSLGVQIASGDRVQSPALSPAPPALLDRLPLDKRGPILSLSVEDHYVRVRTTKGEEMLLMRLSDAMREAAPTPGLQVHRSHWVARQAVTAARREGDRAILTLSHGRDIPASRSHIPALKEAGLLPR